MPIKTLDQKFLHEISDIYDAEHQFLEAQREMIKLAHDEKLNKMLEEHIGQTEQQIANLEKIYELLGQEPKRVKCHAAAGIVNEGQKTIKEVADDTLRDCVIAGAQAKVEHYEIASYEGLVAGAELMGQKDVLKLLQQNLRQEEQTAQKVQQSTPKLIQQAMKAQEVGT